ncbi:MAG: hypothetical protein HOV81_02030 [Kofleriaceae bacterium]|nr:hypothetical protein [Kofleriaceae bacterium]
MAYRGEDAGDALEAPTAEGVLKVVLGPNRVDLSVGPRSLHIADRIATVVEQKRQKQERRASVKLSGTLVVARGWPREAFGLWVELPDTGATRAPMQRMFGVEPADLLEGDGLTALAKLDGLVQRLRAHLDQLAGEVRRGGEIGSGHALDKVLLADHGDRYAIYARRLFRDRARFAMEVFRDGRVIVAEGKTMQEVKVTSRFGVTVRGDYIRFADRHGTDLARVSVPWIGPEDRDELARRIGNLVHQG